MSRVAFWTLCGSILALLTMIIGLALTVSGIIVTIISSSAGVPQVVFMGPQIVVVGIAVGLMSGLFYRVFENKKEENNE